MIVALVVFTVVLAVSQYELLRLDRHRRAAAQRNHRSAGQRNDTH
jgi:hypothetical protein